MATTIDRAGGNLIPTNDTGTPASPVGDGTLLNAAFFTSWADEIDALFNGSTADPFVLGAKLKVDGFGAHTISASGTGPNRLSVRNTSAGTTNYAGLQAGNDTSDTAGQFLAFASTYTTLAQYVANGVLLESTISGGLSVSCSHASGVMRFYTNGAERMRLDTSGRLGIGATPVAGAITVATGAITSGAAIGAFSATHLVIGAGGSSPQAGMITWGDNTGYNLDFGTRASGAFEVRCRMTDGGLFYVADGDVSGPSYSFIGDTNTGMYHGGADDLRFATGGVLGLVLTNSSSLPSARFESGAYGTGAVGGYSLSIGRNSSGSGAAGAIAFNTRTLTNFRYVWVDDSGNLRIHTAQPTENNTTVADTAGTVVGTQTSQRSTKRDIVPFRHVDEALALIRRTPIYGFRYRQSDTDTAFVGIMADESPEFVMHGGQCFNPVNAFGYTAAAIKALIARIEALEARAS